MNMKNKDPVTEELFTYYNNIVFGWKTGKKAMNSEEDQGDSDSSGIEGAICQVQDIRIEPMVGNLLQSNPAITPTYYPGGGGSYC